MRFPHAKRRKSSAMADSGDAGARDGIEVGGLTCDFSTFKAREPLHFREIMLVASYQLSKLRRELWVSFQYTLSTDRVLFIGLLSEGNDPDTRDRA